LPFSSTRFALNELEPFSSEAAASVLRDQHESPVSRVVASTREAVVTASPMTSGSYEPAL